MEWRNGGMADVAVTDVAWQASTLVHTRLSIDRGWLMDRD